MDFLYPYFQNMAQVYLRAIRSIRDLEGKTALSAINPQYANNIRHALEHLATAIQKASSDPHSQQEVEAHMQQVIAHLSSLAPDAYEFISGLTLKESEGRILSAGLFAEINRAKELHNQAIHQYTQGRNERTINPDVAIQYFERAVDLSREAVTSVQYPTKIQKMMFVLAGFAAIGWILALIQFLDKFFQFLPQPTP